MIYLLILIDLAIFAIIDYLNKNKIVKSNGEVVVASSKHLLSSIKTIVFIINIIILIVISGFRYYTGFDYVNYKYMFQRVIWGQPVNVEKGYYYLNVLVQRFTNDHQAIFLLVAVLGLSLKGISIAKLIDKRNFALFIMFGLYFLVGDMGQMRSTFAQAIDLFAILLYLKNYKKTSFIVILIASTIHISSIIMLIMFLVRDKKYNLKVFIMVYIGMAIIGQFLDINAIGDYGRLHWGLAGEKLYGYTVEKSAIKIGLSFNVLFDFAMMLFIVFMRKYYNLGKNKKFNLFFNLYFLGVCSYLLFNNYFVIATRFANYFRLALIILIPMLIDKIENKKIRFAVIALFIIIFSILFIRQLYVHIPIYLPYKMNWFGKVILIS